MVNIKFESKGGKVMKRRFLKVLSITMVMAGFLFYQLGPANALLGVGKRAFEQINEDGFGDISFVHSHASEH